MIDDRLTQLSDGPFALGQAVGVTPTDDAESFIHAGERIRDELLSVAHESTPKRAHEIDQREMKSWIKHASKVLGMYRDREPWAKAVMATQKAGGTAERRSSASSVSDDDQAVENDFERRDPTQKLLSRASLLCPTDLPDETERSILRGPEMVLGRETLEGLDEGAQTIALSLCRMGFFIRVAEVEIVPEARDRDNPGWIPILDAMLKMYDIEDGATPTEADVEAAIALTARFFASEPAATEVLFESVPGLSREVRTGIVNRWLERMASGGCSPSATGLHEQDRLVIYGFALAAVVEAANVSQERGDAEREGRAPRY